ncbi:MAG: hypothetical protein K2P81_07225 [Bacteriovoracaceae bacterium]|nr:hypothetical protein [Bacteriovoracaceae bacterium]
MKFIFSLLLLSLLAPSSWAAGDVSCGAHALEAKFKNLNWSRGVKITATTAIKKIDLTLCIGVAASNIEIERFVIRDRNGDIQISEQIQKFKSPYPLISQNQLPSIARGFIREGNLVSLKVTGAAPQYLGEIRFHRLMGSGSKADIRKLHFKLNLQTSQELLLSYNNQTFDQLVIKIQAIFGPLSMKEFILSDTLYRRSQSIDSLDLQSAASLL